jgi:hypothetical protein
MKPQAAMLDKCANPACFATFRRFRDGRVFVTEIEGERQGSGSGHARQRQYFWLCSSCYRTMTVIVRERSGLGCSAACDRNCCRISVLRFLFAARRDPGVHGQSVALR